MSRPAVALAALLVAAAATPAPAQTGPGEEVHLSLARYEELMGRAGQGTDVRAAWSRGAVAVSLPGDGAGPVEVTVTARVTVEGQGTVSLPVLPAEAILKEAWIGGREASFSARGGVLVASVPAGGGAQDVRLTYVVTPRETGAGARGAVVPLPPLPGADLTVTGAAVDEGLEVWPAADVQRSGARLTAALAAGSGLVLRWAGAGGAHAVRSVDVRMAPDAAGDGVDVDATYEVRLDGARGEVRVAPPGAALVDVREGNEPLAARVSERGHLAVVEGRGRHVVRARFRLPIDRTQGQPRVALGLEALPITRVEVVVPGPRDITFQPSAPVERSVQGEGEAARTRAVAHLPPTEQVVVEWTESRAAPEDLVRVNTETWQLVTLSEAVVRTRAIMSLQVIRGNVREIAVQIPPDAVLYKVSGDGVDDWRTFAASEDAPRQARILLAGDIAGTYTLELELETVVSTAEGTPLALPLVRPLGAFREMGVVALFDGDKVGFAPAEAAGYTKVGEDALPIEVRKDLKDKVSQAFKHVGEPGPITSKVAMAKVKEARFDARVQSLYLVKEGALIGKALVMVEIKSGRRDELILSLPEGVTVLSVTAPSLNKQEPARDLDVGEGRQAHRVSFTRALEGAVQVDLELETLLPKELGRIRLPDVRVEGAEVEEGAFGVTAETGIEVQEAEATDVRRVDAAELPRAVRLRSEREVILGYTYARAPWALELLVRRHQTVETLKAVVSHLWLATTVLEDGHVVSHATFQVTNDDRQFLRLTLPEGHKVWTVAVDGAAVKAVADDKGDLAIPLPKGAEVRVDVVYEVRRDALGLMGRLHLLAPKADLLMTDVRWLVRTPASYTPFGVDTELEEVPEWRFHDGYEPTPGLQMPFSLPEAEAFRAACYTWAVQDPAEGALELGMGLVRTMGPGLGLALLILGVLLLIPVVRRRAARKPLGGSGVALLVAGLALLVFKAVVWGIDPLEGVIAVAVLGVVAAVTVVKARLDGGDA